MKSNMVNTFATVENVDTPRSKFDRSFSYKTTFDAGYLIPYYIDDVLPGDTFNLRTTALARLSTPAFPFMDNMYMDTHYFFVPMRLIWENSKKFFGEQRNPGDTIDYTIPVIISETPAEQSLSDYLGLPIGIQIDNFNALYHRAYNIIWSEWFRDQNLQQSAYTNHSDTADSGTGYVLQRRGKRHDYFTSALPWPQKGGAVNIFGGLAPISTNMGTGQELAIRTTTDNTWRKFSASGALLVNVATSNEANQMFADLTYNTTTTVNDLREAFQVQKLLEHDARGGTRYSEIVRNHFGVNFFDVTYRPEYLGGGSTPINSTPVAQTGGTGTAANDPQGNLAAYSTASFNGHGFSKSFTEHGIVMGLVSVRADLTYQQGIPREFKKSTRYDIFWPSLSHLGEQAILNSEIYYQGTSADEDVFGYQERYAEYRYKPSKITGIFRSTAAAPLDAWHLSQEFTTLPTLGATFIQETPPVDRIIVATDEPHFIFDSFTSLKCARPIPAKATPGLMDHF